MLIKIDCDVCDKSTLPKEPRNSPYLCSRCHHAYGTFAISAYNSKVRAKKEAAQRKKDNDKILKGFKSKTPPPKGRA